MRLATMADLDAIDKIYDGVHSFEEQNAVYTNWQRGVYPTRDLAISTVEAGTMYVLDEDGEIKGCVILNCVEPKEYADVPWEFVAAAGEALVVHTLAIHPDFRGQGLAGKALDFAYELAKSKKCTAIRLETASTNLPAQSLYPKNGYRKAAEVPFVSGTGNEILAFCYEIEVK